MSLQTFVTLSDNETRESAQRLANAWQRPVTVKSKDGRKLRFRCRPSFRTMEDIKKRNAAAGYFWFEPATLRFFSSRVQESCYVGKDGRAYFVSSERGPHGPRLYSVRVAELNGDIKTVGEFQGYRTGRAAHAAAREASNV